MLFNVLKNGCCVEELQLGTIDRLERALALLSGGGVTYRLPDAHGPNLSRPGRQTILRSG